MVVLTRLASRSSANGWFGGIVRQQVEQLCNSVMLSSQLNLIWPRLNSSARCPYVVVAFVADSLSSDDSGGHRRPLPLARLLAAILKSSPRMCTEVSSFGHRPLSGDIGLPHFI